MINANFKNVFRRALFIQIITGWTFLVLASYFIGEIWILNSVISHVGLWLIGMVGIYLAAYWRYKNFLKGEKDLEDTQISSLIYHAVMETSPDSVAVTDLLGNFIFANKQATTLHGYDSPEEFIGKSAFSLFPLSEVTKAAKYMDMTRADGIIRNIEFNLLHKDGTTFPAELSAASIKNEFGIPVAFIAITRDITERKRIADQLHDMNEQLRQQLAEIEKLQKILREQAIQDPLTELYNRRYMEEALKQEIARANRESRLFSIVMIDMDNLKTLNDLYGHTIGDQALKKLGKHIKEMTRVEDIVCRYGGDEFLIILNNTNEEQAQKRIQEWEHKIKTLNIGDKLDISFCAGTATYPIHGNSIEEIIHFADSALYEAKARRKLASKTPTK